MAGMVHSITLVIVLVVLMPYAGMIPMPTIAAILFVVAYNMCQWRTFKQLVETAPKSDILVLVVTFALTVIFDLVVAIEIGMVLACLLFIKRMSEETRAESWVYADDDSEMRLCGNCQKRSGYMRFPVRYSSVRQILLSTSSLRILRNAWYSA